MNAIVGEALGEEANALSAAQSEVEAVLEELQVNAYEQLEERLSKIDAADWNLNECDIRLKVCS